MKKDEYLSKKNQPWTNTFTIQLILFTNGETFNEQTTTWAVFRIKADLVAIIRNSYENIKTLYMLGTSKPRLNLLGGKYLKILKNITIWSVYPWNSQK